MTLPELFFNVIILNNCINSCAADVTLLAPNNAAMNAVALPEGNELEDLLKYHAVAKRISSSNITDEYVENSTAGNIIRFNSYDDGNVSFDFFHS